MTRSCLTVIARGLLVGGSLLAASCGRNDSAGVLPTSPSGSTPTTNVTLRFIHEETPLAGGQQLVLAGSVQFAAGGRALMTVPLQPQTGFTSPRALALPRNTAVVGQIDFPVWASLNIGPQPAGSASFSITPTGTTLESYVVIPVAGPSRLEPCRNGC